MFDIFKRKRIKELETSVEELERINKDLTTKMNEQLTILEKELEDSRTGCSKYVDQITKYEEENEKLLKLAEDLSEQVRVLENKTDGEPSVTLVFDKERYDKIVPIVTYNEDSFERLFELRAIADGQDQNKHAIQLAMLNLAQECLEQMNEDFTGEI